MAASSIHDRFHVKFKIPLDESLLSPNRRMELHTLTESFQRVTEKKKRRMQLLSTASLAASICLFLAIAGLHFFWVLTVAGTGLAVWGFNLWKHAEEDLDRLEVQTRQFLDAVFQDMNEVYEAKKAHGRF